MPPIGGPCLNITIAFCTEKPEWCQPHGEKFENNFFVSIQYTKVTDRLTDRRTPHDGINRAMHSIAASRSKKTANVYQSCEERM